MVETPEDPPLEITSARPSPTTTSSDTGSSTESASGQPHALKRRMTSRHLMMISFGGVIGTGLFLSSGYTVSQAGPIGTILAYAVGSAIVYLVMLCLGELSVAMPLTGAFHVYARRCLGPATGFVTAILYWLTWTVALGSEFTGAAMIMTDWFPSTPAWMWAALFILLILGVNLASVRVFAEAESLLSSIKVLAILAFIVLGALAILGVIPYAGYDSAPLLSNLTADGLFPQGLGAVFTTMLTVNFAFSGTELIGITAGETKDPGTTVPRAIHATLWRLVIFFIGSITVMSALIPWHAAGVEQSPFVTVFNAMGIPFAGTIYECRHPRRHPVRRQFGPVRLNPHAVVAGRRGNGAQGTGAHQPLRGARPGDGRLDDPAGWRHWRPARWRPRRSTSCWSRYRDWP